MEPNKEYEYIEEYFERIKELQKDDYFLETIELVEEMGKHIKNLIKKNKN